MSQSKSSLTYVIQNIVVRVNLNCKLDLNKISDRFPNISYDSNRFPGLFMRIIKPKSVLIIFHSGKIIITGTKIFDDIDFILEILIEQFNKENIAKNKLKKENFEIEIVNIVITADLHNKIDLDLASLVLENSIYEPEVFPGLIYKHYEPTSCTFLIFSTGKIVFTGINRVDIIKPCLDNFERLIRNNELFKS